MSTFCYFCFSTGDPFCRREKSVIRYRYTRRVSYKQGYFHLPLSLPGTVNFLRSGSSEDKTKVHKGNNLSLFSNPTRFLSTACTALENAGRANLFDDRKHHLQPPSASRAALAARASGDSDQNLRRDRRESRALGQGTCSAAPKVRLSIPESK